MWRFIKNDIYLFKPENTTCQNKHTKMTWLWFLNAFHSRNKIGSHQLITPTLLIAINLKLPTHYWDEKKKKKPPWNSGKVVHQYTTIPLSCEKENPLHYQISHEFSELQDAFVLLKQNM